MKNELRMFAAGRVWENEIVIASEQDIYIVTEQDCWRSQIEHEISIEDTLEADCDELVDEYNDWQDDVEFIRHGGA